MPLTAAKGLDEVFPCVFKGIVIGSVDDGLESLKHALTAVFFVIRARDALFCLLLYALAAREVEVELGV